MDGSERDWSGAELMGMFDTINVQGDVDLPGLPIGCNRRFQTKSLGMSLSVFTLTNGGRLTEKIDSSKGWKWHDTEYHGDITFYTNYETMWYEFTAKLTDGQLMSMEAAPVRECGF